MCSGIVNLVTELEVMQRRYSMSALAKIKVFREHLFLAAQWNILPIVSIGKQRQNLEYVVDNLGPRGPFYALVLKRDLVSCGYS